MCRHRPARRGLAIASPAILLSLLASAGCMPAGNDRRLPRPARPPKGELSATGWGSRPPPTTSRLAITASGWYFVGLRRKARISGSWLFSWRIEPGAFEIVGQDAKPIPPGRYRVAVGLGREGGTDELQGKYGPQNSPIEVEVRPGEDLVIDLNNYRRMGDRAGSGPAENRLHQASCTRTTRSLLSAGSRQMACIVALRLTAASGRSRGLFSRRPAATPGVRRPPGKGDPQGAYSEERAAPEAVRGGGANMPPGDPGLEIVFIKLGGSDAGNEIRVDHRGTARVIDLIRAEGKGSHPGKYRVAGSRLRWEGGTHSRASTAGRTPRSRSKSSRERTSSSTWPTIPNGTPDS